MEVKEVIRRLCVLGYLEFGRECEYLEVLKEVKLPWCGVVESRCVRIKKNGGLYTQCDGKKEYGEECKVCSKKEKKYGDVKDRMSVGIMEYMDSEGNGPVQYIKVMKRNGWSKERVLLEGKMLGVSVPLCHFVEEVGKRGRPRKSCVEKGVEVEKCEKKKRGRPRKEKKSSNIAGEELIASLLKERDEEVVNEEVINEEVINEEVINEEEGDEEETVVVKYEIGGVTYLKTVENVLYDMECHELVGVWNEKTKKIEVCEEEE
jgi:hypothetical protein